MVSNLPGGALRTSAIGPRGAGVALDRGVTWRSETCARVAAVAAAALHRVVRSPRTGAGPAVAPPHLARPGTWDHITWVHDANGGDGDGSGWRPARAIALISVLAIAVVGGVDRSLGLCKKKKKKKKERKIKRE